jgi:hypothetical protein
MMQRTIVLLSSAFLFGFTPITPRPSDDAAQRLSAELRQALPGLIVSGDYQTASRLYFDLATARSRDHEFAPACAALANSLDNYRKGLANDAGVPWREVAAESRDDDEGMQDIRARFGCTRAQFS